jgi:aarF domain-containing kinase
LIPRFGALQIAQQLSTRVDLVPPPYLEEFKRLQVFD